MEKALFCAHTAKSMADFAWYYATYGSDYKWDVVVDVNSEFEKQKQCFLDTGLFDNVYDSGHDIWDHKVILLIKYIWYFITCRRRKMAEIIIKKSIPDIYEYKKVILVNDSQPIEGAIGLLSGIIDVEMLEDGACDYDIKRSIYQSINHSFFSDFSFFLIAKMGYMSAASRYRMKYHRMMNKYATCPDKMSYKEYKSIKQLGDMRFTDTEKYYAILKKIFNYDENVVVPKDNVILFTSPLLDFSENIENVNEKTIDYIVDNYRGKTIYVKRHPRDNGQYLWPDWMNVIEINKELPAELISSLEFEEKVYMFPSTLLVLNEQQRGNTILFYEDLKNVNEKSKPVYYDNFTRTINGFGIDKECIVKI